MGSAIFTHGVLAGLVAIGWVFLIRAERLHAAQLKRLTAQQTKPPSQAPQAGPD